MTHKLPYLPFARPTIDEASIAGVAEVFRSGWIASGPNVLAFEKALSARHGGRPVRTLTSGTAALEIALQIAGIGPGDEVITSAMSFFAAPNMILRLGAKPVFVDCELASRNMDLEQAEAAITPRTRAILPTHFAGLALDMDRLYGLAQRRNLRVIEDAALAIGSSWRGKPIGSFGDMAAFSFHPNKNMTTIEGGALVLRGEEDAKLAERLRFHGIARLADGTRDVEVVAGKYNMSDVSARLGLAQLERLDEFNARRRQLAARYFARLKGGPFGLPQDAPEGRDDEHSWNMFCVLLPLERMTMSRKQFMDALHARGIGTGISYEALHLTTVGRKAGYAEGMFPNAERIARETLTLPLFFGMADSDVDRVCDELEDVIEHAVR
ncbi:MAG TPA: DegT/DnrJ/EryC1/StrS aminotransferase family protein [Burkholderiales bacterium]|nr:DegT/DnrJ/EryC1/StrS aminotransferase family protein [Burkholderiales bacterium]